MTTGWRSLATIVCALAVLGPSGIAADERQAKALTAMDIANVHRLVFCSSHPEVSIDSLKIAAAERGLIDMEIVSGFDHRESTSKVIYYAAVSDGAIEGELTHCMETFPEPFFDAVTDVVDQIGKPHPKIPKHSAGYGPVWATGRVLRGDRWIGSIDAIAFTGGGLAQSIAFETIFPAQ